MPESKARSIVKTISWRILGSLITSFTVYFLTGSMGIGTTVFFVNILINTTIYFIHERVWSRIKWGYNGKA